MRDYFHFIQNLPEAYPWYKRVYANLVFNVGRIRVPYTFQEVSMARSQIRDLHQPGDILLMGAKNHLGQWAISGVFTHSGVINHHGRLVHAHVDGVEEVDLDKILPNYDHFALLRPKKRGEKWKIELNQLLAQQIGIPYDFEFSKPGKDLGRFYCTELVYWSYLQLGLELVPMESRRIIHPMDFLESDGTTLIFSTS